jgi:murein DD-endopeptidase MepM/ murein hydrolase activator NlpD
VKRLVATLAAVGLIPVVAWASASAGPESAADCTSPTTDPGAAACVSAAPAEAVEPVTAPSTTPPPAAPDTTVVVEASESTTAPTTAVPTTEPPPTTTPEASSTTAALTEASSPPTETTSPEVDPDATTTTTVDLNATTSTTSPAVDPDSTTTTTVDPNAATTTTVASAPPPDDIETAPVAPPVEAPSGRVVVPNGTVDTGQVRAVTFPVAGPVSYVNDFGACRDNCTRFHKGNDLIGDRLQPLLAMHDGVIDHLINHPTAGFGVAIRDDEGWRYDTYHMNNDSPGTDDAADDGTWRFLPGIVAGARVTAGQQIGWMGDSGNAEGSVPHVHVEIHTPDGQAVDPYWSLRAAQQAVNCAVGTVGEPLPVTPATAPDAAAPTTSTALSKDLVTPAQALVGQTDRGTTTTSAPGLAMTTKSDAEAAADWLASGWTTAALPAGWRPFTVTGGHPGSGQVAAKFWISTQGYTPVDAAAARVGDPRYDAGMDCSQPAVTTPSASIPAELGAILATIRAMETGGDYGTTVTTSSASGAYAFLDSSWGGFGGYARAKDAPPGVQDAKAAAYATYLLQRHNGDVSTVPVSWYIGHVPVGAEWDTVPVPTAGNKLTPRQYQDRWMRRYAQMVGDPSAWVTGVHESGAPQAADTSASCHTVVIDVGDDGSPQYALTQARSFLVDADGRAVPNAQDPCDPGRVLAAAAPPTPVAPDAPAPVALATLVPPVVIKTSGLR